MKFIVYYKLEEEEFSMVVEAKNDFEACDKVKEIVNDSRFRVTDCERD